jgi:phospholipid/cholesterol/gamma-HCH transport system substrate-binding protein
VSRAVISLTQVAQALAVQDTPLRETLQQLPNTLSTARRVLDKVPGTVTAATPLLKDAQPLAKQLGSVSRDLRPILTDLRATVTDLRPALADAASVLNGTPSLLDNANALLPGLNQTVQGVLPALQFVRPYTPELAGWLSNWASATANYDSLGNYARIWAQKGPADVNGTPSAAAQVIESGLLRKHEQRLPGQLADQSWTDANGSGMR